MVKILRNLSTAQKLMIGFSIVLILLIVVSVVGLTNMSKISDADSALYNENTIAMTDLAKIYDLLAGQRICANNMLIFFESDPAFAAEELDSLTEKETEIQEYFETFASSILEGAEGAEERAIYNSMVAAYNADFSRAKTALRTAYQNGDIAGMTAAVASMDANGSDISDHIDEAFEYNRVDAEDKEAANNATYDRSFKIILTIMIIALALTVLLAIGLSVLIGAPIKRVLDFITQVGEQGKLRFSSAEMERLRFDTQAKDEIGRLTAGFYSMLESMLSKADTLSQVADGDLTVKVNVLGAEDTLSLAMDKMVTSLSDMFSEINHSSDQVTAGSKQIADSAQALAQGSTEQASAVEQLSSSIAEVSESIRSAATAAASAATLSAGIREKAETGTEQMNQMIVAVRDINDASRNISNVIALIDNIAFQTNILALNASVEAARAGQHGRGFAVVAEEVRSLAGQSSDAAKTTGEMIKASLEKAELGSQIADATNASLREIVEGVKQTSDIVSEIAASAERQAQAITQINTGVDQVAQVVQQNSATSEQSAAAAEEMSGQAEMLTELVGQFKLESAPARPALGAKRPQQQSRTGSIYLPPQEQDAVGFGKY